MKTSLLHFLFILTTLMSCSNVPTSSQDIINRSIAFHDVNNNWKAFDQQLKFESRFSFNDSIPEELHLSFKTANNYFRYMNTDRKVDLEYFADSCISHTPEGNCNGYSWTSKFYPYIWGLPMKLRDPETQVQSNFKPTVFNGFKTWKIQVNYEAENFWFFFDQLDYQLRGFKFLKNDSSGKGEIIVLKDLVEVDGILLPKHRTWLHKDSSLIGTNELLEIE
jgi:hypothetical protein